MGYRWDATTEGARYGLTLLGTFALLHHDAAPANRSRSI
jgi:hypothetical protein